MDLYKQEDPHFPVAKGKYIDWVHAESTIRKHTVALQCPVCSRAFCLANHQIVNGIVSPSVVCPYNCGFHEFLVLR